MSVFIHFPPTRSLTLTHYLIHFSLYPSSNTTVIPPCTLITYNALIYSFTSFNFPSVVTNIYQLTFQPNVSLIHTFNSFFPSSINQSIYHPFIYQLYLPIVTSFNHQSVHTLIHSFVHPFLCSLTHPPYSICLSITNYIRVIKSAVHDLEVMGSNLMRVKFGVHSTSV